MKHENRRDPVNGIGTIKGEVEQSRSTDTADEMELDNRDDLWASQSEWKTGGYYTRFGVNGREAENRASNLPHCLSSFVLLVVLLL